MATPRPLPTNGPHDPGAEPDRPMRSRALARLAVTGIYLLRGVSRSLQQAARARAVREGTTLRRVLLQGLHEYAAGTWTPSSDAEAATLPRSTPRGQTGARFIQTCASQNDLFALDAEGGVHQYNFTAKAWEKLVASRSPE
jgi:hypothetical protein